MIISKLHAKLSQRQISWQHLPTGSQHHPVWGSHPCPDHVVPRPAANCCSSQQRYLCLSLSHPQSLFLSACILSQSTISNTYSLGFLTILRFRKSCCARRKLRKRIQSSSVQALVISHHGGQSDTHQHPPLFVPLGQKKKRFCPRC